METSTKLILVLVFLLLVGIAMTVVYFLVIKEDEDEAAATKPAAVTTKAASSTQSATQSAQSATQAATQSATQAANTYTATTQAAATQSATTQAATAAANTLPPTKILYSKYIDNDNDLCTTTDMGLHCTAPTNRIPVPLGRIFTAPIPGETTELYFAYSSRVTDSCTYTSEYPFCHGAESSQQSLGHIYKKQMPSTYPLLYSFNNRVGDTCVFLAGNRCHDDGLPTATLGYLLPV